MLVLTEDVESVNWSPSLSVTQETVSIRYTQFRPSWILVGSLRPDPIPSQQSQTLVDVDHL